MQNFERYNFTAHPTLRSSCNFTLEWASCAPLGAADGGATAITFPRRGEIGKVQLPHVDRKGRDLGAVALWCHKVLVNLPKP